MYHHNLRVCLSRAPKHGPGNPVGLIRSAVPHIRSAMAIAVQSADLGCPSLEAGGVIMGIDAITIAKCACLPISVLSIQRPGPLVPHGNLGLCSKSLPERLRARAWQPHFWLASPNTPSPMKPPLHRGRADGTRLAIRGDPLRSNTPPRPERSTCASCRGQDDVRLGCDLRAVDLFRPTPTTKTPWKA